MAKTKQQKKQTVTDLTDKLDRIKSVIFADFTGLKVNEAQELRDKCKEQGIDVLVTKKTLLKKGLEKVGIKDIDPKQFEGQVAVFFGYEDEVAPAKSVFDFSKKHEALKITGGIMENKFIDLSMVQNLAKLPSKQELLAKAVRSISAPISGFVNVLAGNLRGLVNVINAIKDNKS